MSKVFNRLSERLVYLSLHMAHNKSQMKKYGRDAGQPMSSICQGESLRPLFE